MGASKGQIYQPRDAHLYLAPDWVDVGTLRSQVCVALCLSRLGSHPSGGSGERSAVQFVLQSV